jgi:hypothetical protein
VFDVEQQRLTRALVFPLFTTRYTAQPPDLSSNVSPVIKLLYSSPADAIPLASLLEVQRSGARCQGMPLDLDTAADRNRYNLFLAWLEFFASSPLVVLCSVCVALASGISAMHTRRVGHGALSPHMVAVSPAGTLLSFVLWLKRPGCMFRCDMMRCDVM